MARSVRFWPMAAALLAACSNPVVPSVGAAAPSPGAALFDANCLACHSVGLGDKVGPDLKDVSKRRSKDWLVRWIDDPAGMMKTDAVAKELLAKWKVPMPDANLAKGDIEAILAYVDEVSAAGGMKAEAAAPVVLSDAEFAATKRVYFDRCAGCHGTLRAGATGPKITEDVMVQRGTATLKAVLTNGTPGGMPAWGKLGVLTEAEIDAMARFLQLPPPEPPQLPLAEIQKTWKLDVPVDARPKKPQTKRNWQNYFGVVLRDAGKVAILDGESKELVTTIDAGFAVHILRASSSGRYLYAVGRDGVITMIDLWTETPTRVARVQGCFDARSVDGSKFKGFEDKLAIEGCYWPPQYVVLDGQTLEPKSVTNVLTPAYDTNEELKEVRVAAIVASHYAPNWLLNLKESGHVAVVDYSKPGYPIVNKIAAERFLHDGGWDHTKRYYMVAANMRDQMAIIDTKLGKLASKFVTGIKPHPGRGANWEDPVYGWVNGTTHLGEGKLAVYGADPEKHPEHAWKVVREIPLPAAGGLFLKTHDNSDWVWVDMPLASDPSATRQVCVYGKKSAKIEKCWTPTEKGRTVHFEYDKTGEEMWISGWDKQGELIVYKDDTLAEIKRISGDWLVTPTGKFNVFNTQHDVY